MQFTLLLVFALVVAINANFISRSCDCYAVSDTIHYQFKKFSGGSCKICSCSDPAVKNCQQACQQMIRTFAQSGCGIVLKGSQVKYQWDAGSCSSGISDVKYPCA